MRVDFRSLRTRPYQLLLAMATAFDPMSPTSGLRAWAGIPCRWHGFWFAIPQAEITENMAVPEWMDIPNAPAWVLGLCQWRGQLVPLIDPQNLLHGGRTLLTAQSRVLIYADKAQVVAFLVDEVATGMIFQSHDQQNVRDSGLGFAQEWQFCLIGSARRISALTNISSPQFLSHQNLHLLTQNQPQNHASMSLWPQVSLKKLAQHPLLQQSFIF